MTGPELWALLLALKTSLVLAAFLLPKGSTMKKLSRASDHLPPPWYSPKLSYVRDLATGLYDVPPRRPDDAAPPSAPPPDAAARTLPLFPLLVLVLALVGCAHPPPPGTAAAVVTGTVEIAGAVCRIADASTSSPWVDFVCALVDAVSPPSAALERTSAGPSAAPQVVRVRVPRDAALAFAAAHSAPSSSSPPPPSSADSGGMDAE